MQTYNDAFIQPRERDSLLNASMSLKPDNDQRLILHLNHKITLR